MQSDIPEAQSAFPKIYGLFDDEVSQQNGIHTFEFGTEDILRSELVKFIVEKLQLYGKQLK